MKVRGVFEKFARVCKRAAPALWLLVPVLALVGVWSLTSPMRTVRKDQGERPRLETGLAQPPSRAPGVIPDAPGDAAGRGRPDSAPPGAPGDDEENPPAPGAPGAETDDLFDDAAKQKVLASVPAADQRYVVKLKSRFFLPEKDKPIRIEAEAKRLFLQFHDHPDEGRRKELASLGVALERYASDYCWYARIPRDSLGAVRRLEYVKGLAEILPADKMPARVYRGSPGVWARNADGTATYRVQFVDGTPFEQARDALAAALAGDLGQGVDSSEFSYGNRILAKIRPESVSAVASIDEVEWVCESEPPKIAFNAVAAQRAKVNQVRDGAAPYNLTGNGVIVGEWDEGPVGVHSDFGTRVTVMDSGTVSTHSTHVAGTVMGSGIANTGARGMACKLYAAPGDEDIGALLHSYDWNNPLTEQTNAASAYPNMRVSTHSWGYVTGWYWDGAAWVNAGNAADFGDYNADSRDWDQMVRNTGLIVCKAAGNEKTDGSGATDATHDGRKTAPTPDWDDWYDCIGTIAMAKNIITVGATQDDDTLADFSSIGPADDGRVKPDVVMNGYGVLSTYPNNTYSSISGTSMATPGVAGACALLVESWRNNNGGANPGNDVVKAVLAHTAGDLGNAGPDYRYGFGIVNADDAVTLVRNDSLDSTNKYIVADSLTNGQTRTYSVIVTAGSPYWVTLVWMDPQGNPAAANAIINDLDVVLVEPNGTTQHFAWRLDPTYPQGPATRPTAEVPTLSFNTKDTLEQVTVDSPAAGTWTIQVTGTSIPSGPQAFALVSSRQISGSPPKTWTGASNTNWNTGGNWNPAGAPTASDNVVIPNVANDPLIDATSGAAACKTMTITTGIVTINGQTLTVSGNFDNSGTVTATGGTVDLKRDFKNTGVLTTAAGNTFTFSGTVNQSITTDGDSFVNLTVNNTGGSVVVQSGNIVVTGNVSVTAGTFGLGSSTGHAITGTTSINGGTLEVSQSTAQLRGAVTVTGGGRLSMTSNGTLRLGAVGVAGSVSIGNGATAGTFYTRGTSASIPTVTAFDTGGPTRYSFTVTSTGTVDIGRLNFAYPDNNGLTISDGTTVVDIDNVAFTDVGGATGTYLRVLDTGAGPVYAFSGCSFDANCQYNVSSVAGYTSNIVMTGWSGARGGETYENDRGAGVDANGNIDWVVVNSPTVLIWDNDGGRDFETYLRDALVDAGYWSSNITVTPGGADLAGYTLSNYSVVIVTLGVFAAGTITAAQQTQLTNYMTAGGDCFIEGGDFGFDYGATTLYTYFGSLYQSDGAIASTGNVSTLQGQASTHAAGMSFNYAFQTTPDHYVDDFTFRASAPVGTMAFTSDGVSTEGRGIQYGTGNSQRVYYSVSYAGILNSGANTRAQLMGAMMTYMGYTPPPASPSISSISPSTLLQTAGATSVTIAGTALANAIAVELRSDGGFVRALTINTNSATQITATLNPSSPSVLAEGYYDLVVTTPVASSSQIDNFLVYAPGIPIVQKLTPAACGNNVTCAVTIDGGSFTGATGVTVAGTPLTSVTVVTDSRITATVPSGITPGTYLVVVTNGSGSNTDGAMFTVHPSGRYFYVSKSGNDGTGAVNNPNLPYLTIGAAETAVGAAGLTSPNFIEIQDQGVYNEKVTIAGMTPTAVNRLTLRTMPGKWATISGGGQDSGVYVNAVNYVTIANLVFSRTPDALASAGVWLNNSDSGIITNCVARGFAYGFRVANGSNSAQVINNTAYITTAGANFTYGLFLDAQATASDCTARSNVFFTNASYPECACIWVYAGTTLTSSDYNNLYATGGAAVVRDYSTLTAWQTASAKDANSISSNPLFVSTSAYDFHLRSTRGYWTSAGFVNHPTDYSPCIDAGAPADAYSAETYYNGGRINQGAYGNTAQASRSKLGDTCWTGGAGTTSWNTAGNWTNGVPSASKSAEIVDATYDPVLDVNATVKYVIVSSGTLTLNNALYTLTSNGKCESLPGSTLTMSNGTLAVKGDFTCAGTLSCTGGIVRLNGSADQTIGIAGGSVWNLDIASTGGFVRMSGDANVGAGLSVTSGYLWLDTNTVTLGGALTTASGSTLRLNGPAVLKLSTSGAVINGMLMATAFGGAPKSEIRPAQAGSFYPFSIQGPGSGIDVFGLKLFNLDNSGLLVGADCSITRIDNIDFQSGQNGANATYLNLNMTSGVYVLRLNSFDSACTYNVALRGGANGESTAAIQMENSSGAKGDNDISDGWTGESVDRDPDGDMHIVWKYFKVWMGVTNSLWSVASNWEGGVAPVSGDDILINPAANGCVLTSNVLIRDLTIASGGTLSLGTYTLEITGDTFRADGGQFNAGTGTVRFGGTLEQTVNSGLNPLYNLDINKPGGKIVLAADLAIQNNLSLTQGELDVRGFTLSMTRASGPNATCTSAAGALLTLGTTSRVDCSAFVDCTFSGTVNLSSTAEFVSGGNLTLQSSGSLNLDGNTRLRMGDAKAALIHGTFRATGSTPTVTKTASGIGGFSFTVGDGVSTGTIDVSALNFSYAGANGLYVRSRAAITLLQYANFSNGAAGGTHLRIDRGTSPDPTAYTLVGHSFTAISGGGFNVTANGTVGNLPTFTMSMSSGDWGGPTNGEANDSETNATVTWNNSATWVGKWRFKRQITILAGTSAVPNGYFVCVGGYDVGINTTGAEFTSGCEGNDIRIVYTGGATPIEIPRSILDSKSASTQIWFPVQAAIGASGSNSNYWMYYGASAADSANPPTIGPSTGFFSDDMEKATDPGWTHSGSYDTWEKGTPTGYSSGPAAAYRGSKCWSTDLNGPYLASADVFNDTLYTPVLNTTGKTGMKVFYQRWSRNPDTADTFSVGSETTGDTTWWSSGTASLSETAWGAQTYNAWDNGASTNAAGADNKAAVQVLFALVSDADATVGDGGNIDNIIIRPTLAVEPTATASATEYDIKGNWAEAFNWSPPSVPGGTTDVNVNGGYSYSPRIGGGSTVSMASLDVQNTPVDADALQGLYLNRTAPWTGAFLYGYVGVTQASGPHDALGCDLDAWPPFDGLGTISGNTNAYTELSDAQYVQMSTSDNVRYPVPAAGVGDLEFLWCRTMVNQPSSTITQIVFTFEGYPATAGTVSIYLYNSNTSTWDAAALASAAFGTSDQTLTGTLASGFSNYIDSSGLLRWGVFANVVNVVFNVDYVKVDVSATFDPATPSTISIGGRVNCASSGRVVNQGADVVKVGGDWSCTGQFTPNSSSVVFNKASGPQGVTMTPGAGTTNTFDGLTIGEGASTPTVTMGSAVKTRVLTVTEGTLRTGGYNLTLTGAVPHTADAGGTLSLAGGSTLAIAGGGTLLVNLNGTFQTYNTSGTSRATVTRDTAGIYYFRNYGNVNAPYCNFSYMATDTAASPAIYGLKFYQGSTLTSLANCNFDYPEDDASGLASLIDFSSFDGTTGNGRLVTATLAGCDFRKTGAYTFTVFNVTGGVSALTNGSVAGAHGIIAFDPATGAFAREADDNDANGKIIWPPLAIPDVVAAVASDDSGGGAGIQFGDKVTITFSGATNAYPLTSGNINGRLQLSSSHTWGSIVSAIWSTGSKPNDTLTILMGTGATVVVGDSITVLDPDGNPATPDTVMDATESCNATGSPPSISGSFGVDAPDLTQAVANEGGASESGPGPGDTVVVRFDAPTNGFLITTGVATNVDSVLALSAGHTWGAIAGAVWTTQSYANDTLTLTLDTGATVAIGDSLTILGNTLKDITNSVAAVGSPPLVAGNFGTVDTPALSSAVADDASGLGAGIHAGDRVVLTFTYPTNAFAITAANIDTVLFLDLAHTWRDSSGQIGSAVWSGGNTVLTITLSTTGGSPTVAVSDSITIPAGTLRDASGTNDATDSPPSISGSFGALPTPAVTSITAQDTSGGGPGIQAGDQVVLSFSNPTDLYDVTLAPGIGSNLPITGKPTGWGTIGPAQWVSSSVLVITLGAGATIAVGDSVGLLANTIELPGGGNQPDAVGFPMALTGSFGTPLTPDMTAAVASDTGAGAGVNNGDTVVLAFSCSTNAYGGGQGGAWWTTNINSILQLEGGTRSWGGIVSGAWTTTTNSNDTLTITVSGAGAPTIAVGQNIAVIAGTVKDSTGTMNAIGSPPGITGSFGAIPVPQVISAVATGAGTAAVEAGDRLTLRFNAATNGYNVLAGSGINVNLPGWDASTGGAPRLWGGVSTVLWSTSTYTNDTLTVTFTGSGTQIAVGHWIDMLANTIEAASGGADATGWRVQVTGSFAIDAPDMTSAVAQDSANKAGLQPNVDLVAIKFDRATNAYGNGQSLTWWRANIGTILPLNSGLGSWGTLQSTPVWTSAPNPNDTLTVRVGTNADIATGYTVSIGAGTIRNSTGVVDAVGSPPTISGGFGARPVLVSATAADDSLGEAGIQNGDTLTLRFNAATNQYGLTTANADNALPVTGKDWGSVASSVWTDSYRTLRVTMGSAGTPPIARGDMISAESLAPPMIRDQPGTANATGSVPIGGTFDATETGGAVYRLAAPGLTYATIQDALNAVESSDETIEVRDNIIRSETLDLSGLSYDNLTIDGAVLRPPSGSPAVIGSGDTTKEVLRNCVIIRNTSTGTPVVRNVGRVFFCTIVGPYAAGANALVEVSGTSNCDVWGTIIGNPAIANWGTGGNPINKSGAGTLSVGYSDVQNGGYVGTNMTNGAGAANPQNPQFTNFDAGDGVDYSTGSGLFDVHLRATSPCIDFAAAPTPDVTTDFDRGSDFENPGTNPRRPVLSPNGTAGFGTWDDTDFHDAPFTGAYDIGADEFGPLLVGAGNRPQGVPLWTNRAGTGVLANPDSFSVPITSFTFSPAVVFVGENNNVNQGAGRDVRLVAYAMNDADSNGALDVIDSLDLTGAGIQKVHSITSIGAGTQENLYLVVDTNGDPDTDADAILAVSYTPSAAPNELAVRLDWTTNPAFPAGNGKVGRIVIGQSDGRLYFPGANGRIFRLNSVDGSAPAASGNWLGTGQLNLAALGYDGVIDPEGSLYAGKFNNSLYAPTNGHSKEIIRIQLTDGSVPFAKDCGTSNRNHFGFNLISQSVFVTGADQYVWRAHEDTLAFNPWVGPSNVWPWQSEPMGAGVRTTTRAQMFRTVDANVRVGAGGTMYKFRKDTGVIADDSDGAGDDWGPGRTFRGNIITSPTLIGGTGKDYTPVADGRRCGKIVFGTDQGYCYVVSYIRATLASDAEENNELQPASASVGGYDIRDGRPYPGFPYRIPGVKIVSLSLLTSSTVGRQVIVFITDNGWAYGFIEPY